MAPKSSDFEGWLIGPRLLRALAVVVGVTGLALPVLVVRWLTETTPPPEGLGVGPLRPEMVVVPAGDYTSGSPDTEAGRRPDEQLHRVTLSPFAIAITEVTQEQYERVMGANPATDRSCGGDCPVTGVSWLDAVKYLNALSERDPAVQQPCYRIDGEDVECVFECDDGYEGLAPVARFRPNGFRLFDMTGNVWEWVWDWYGDYEGDARDPFGPASGRYRVIRGGSFAVNPRLAPVACRSADEPSSRNSNLGFRVARSLP